MTREQAINELTQLLHEDFLSEYAEAIRMAIKALELESESRMKYVKEAVYAILNTCDTDSIADNAMRNAAKFVQNAIDGSYPDFEKLEQEPCEDCINREDALQALCKAVHKNDDTIPCSNQRVSCLWDKTKVQDYAEEILRLPSVTPQPKKMGRWTHDGSHWENRWICSECGYKLIDVQTNYCPNCGANMSEISIRAESEEV